MCKAINTPTIGAICWLPLPYCKSTGRKNENYKEICFQWNLLNILSFKSNKIKIKNKIITIKKII